MIYRRLRRRIWDTSSSAYAVRAQRRTFAAQAAAETTMAETDTDLLDDLRSRNLVQDCTPHFLREDEAIYAGCDPTADSLHIGNLAVFTTLFRFQLAGYRTIALIGGATGLIGDPAGKKNERPLLTSGVLHHNAASIEKQLCHLHTNMMAFAKKRQLTTKMRFDWQVVNNKEWYQQMNVLDFVRNAGKHVRMSNMLHIESVKQRLRPGADGMSFTEFAYQLFQAWDWCHLAQHHKCYGQLGGSDQWGNIVAGIDLIDKRAVETGRKSREAFGLTIPLLTDTKGEKIGKSTAANDQDRKLWLSPQRLHPFDFYQQLLQMDDTVTRHLLKCLTFLRPEEADNLMEDRKNKSAQLKLASDVTELVHGTEAEIHARMLSDYFFSVKKDTNARTLSADQLRSFPRYSHYKRQNPVRLIDEMVAHQVAASRNDARRLLQSRAVSINGQTVAQDIALRDVPSQVLGSYSTSFPFLTIRAGKKNHIILVELEE